jgi:hypothetical protein
MLDDLFTGAYVITISGRSPAKTELRFNAYPPATARVRHRDPTEAIDFQMISQLVRDDEQERIDPAGDECEQPGDAECRDGEDQKTATSPEES